MRLNYLALLMGLGTLLFVAACGDEAPAASLESLTPSKNVASTPATGKGKQQATPAPTTTPEPTFTPQPTPTPTLTPDQVLTAFKLPIPNAPIPGSDNLMPGAARAYRNGAHEGIDFYYDSQGAILPIGTQIFAAKDGKVVRTDWDYKEVTAEEMEAMLAKAAAAADTPSDILDRLRGRQVWVDVGGGVITRYAHLESIAPGLAVGQRVEQGQFIATVGNSGTPEASDGTQDGPHLHFEIWVNGKYLGQGIPVTETRKLLQKVFSTP